MLVLIQMKALPEQTPEGPRTLMNQVDRDFVAVHQVNQATSLS
jgi:hypothetical protein